MKGYGKKYLTRRKKPKETQADYLRRHAAIEHKDAKFIKNQLIQKNGAVCAICGKVMTNKKEVTLDHIKSKSKGGLTTLENCQLACLECNMKKGDRYDG